MLNPITFTFFSAFKVGVLIQILIHHEMICGQNEPGSISLAQLGYADAYVKMLKLNYRRSGCKTIRLCPEQHANAAEHLYDQRTSQ